MKTKKIK